MTSKKTILKSIKILQKRIEDFNKNSKNSSTLSKKEVKIKISMSDLSEKIEEYLS